MGLKLHIVDKYFLRVHAIGNGYLYSCRRVRNLEINRIFVRIAHSQSINSYEVSIIIDADCEGCE